MLLFLSFSIFNMSGSSLINKENDPINTFN